MSASTFTESAKGLIEAIDTLVAAPGLQKLFASGHPLLTARNNLAKALAGADALRVRWDADIADIEGRLSARQIAAAPKWAPGTRAIGKGEDGTRHGEGASLSVEAQLAAMSPEEQTTLLLKYAPRN